MSGSGSGNRWFSVQDISEEEEHRVAHFFASENESSDDDSVGAEYEDESDFDDSVADPNYVPDLNDLNDNELFGDEVNDEEQEEVEIDEGSVGAIGPNRGQKYKGQGKDDKTVWWSMPSEDEIERNERMKENRMRSFAYCREPFTDKLKAFMRILPTSIIGQIVIETNRKAKRAYQDNLRSGSPKRMRKWRDTDTDELYGFIAILLYSGAEKSHSVHATDLFDESNMPFYRAVMSLSRFQQLSRFIRFDDSRTRIARLREVKLAPFRYVWEMFMKNLVMPYVPSLELCADEQLLTTRNRCSFRQYLPLKPGKYGVKIFWLVDSQTNYPIAGEVYLGKQPKAHRSTGVAHDLIMRLAKDYLYLGANITLDNFFVSYKLAQSLVAKDTTITGTIRPKKRELPSVFTSAEEAKKRGPNQSIFCFSNECELVSYTSNSNKNVLLLSTAHATEAVNEQTGKPLVIHSYNEHKGGVDTMDKMLRGYTCKRRNARWPMLLFFNVIDVAALAAYRLCELSNPAWRSNKKNKRKIFLKELAFELAQNQMEKRSKIPNLMNKTKLAMSMIGFKPKEPFVAKRKMPVIQVKYFSFFHFQSFSHTHSLFHIDSYSHYLLHFRSLSHSHCSLSYLSISFPHLSSHMQVKNPPRRCEQCKKSRSTKDNKTTASCDLCLSATCAMHYVRACEDCYLTKFKDPEVDEMARDEEEDGEFLPDDVAGPSSSEPRSKKARRESTINL